MTTAAAFLSAVALLMGAITPRFRAAFPAAWGCVGAAALCLVGDLMT